jgi:hypothetical protein
MSGIFVRSFGPTWRTSSGLARTSRSGRMIRSHAPFTRPAASKCDLKSAVYTIGTNGKPPDRDWLHRARDRNWTWFACGLVPRHLQSGVRRPLLTMADSDRRMSLSRRTDYSGRSPVRRLWRWTLLRHHVVGDANGDDRLRRVAGCIGARDGDRVLASRAVALALCASARCRCSGPQTRHRSCL